MTEAIKSRRGHIKGADLGGIRSVETLQLRCRVDDITGCWTWAGAAPCGWPNVHFRHPVSGQLMTSKGRRVSLILARGMDLPKGHVAWQRACCDNALCVNPDHSRSGTKKEWGRWLTASGKVKNLPSKAAGARAVWDKRGRKITPESASLIRSSTASNHELAKKLGVSYSSVWSVRQGLSHNVTLQNASVWTYRP